MDQSTGRAKAATGSQRRIGRFGAGLLAVALLLAVAVPALAVDAASTVEGRAVRVRVLADASRIELVDAAGNTTKLRATASGLMVAGQAVTRHLAPAARGPHQVRGPAGDVLELRGSLQVRRGSAGLDVINVLPLEDYVAGTLGGEMFASWEPAALAAQAVACRSYVLYQMGRREDLLYDVSADVSSQRYLGVRGEAPATWAAVRATTGEILRYDGAPALAAFHSASGGRTASAQEVWGEPIPYLRSVPVENEDDSPDTYWRASVSEGNLSRGLAALGFEIGRLEQVEVVKRSPSGRVSEVSFRGSQGRAKVTGRALRRMLGSTTIKSTMFEVRGTPREWVFVGSGNGHGVGMSQWAAQAMAREGETYRGILGKFYPGTEIGQVAEADRQPRFAGLAPLPASTKNPLTKGRRPLRRDHLERMGDRPR